MADFLGRVLETLDRSHQAGLDRLFEFVDDRHVGQILVRYLTRREDITYLQQLSRRSRHVEVRDHLSPLLGLGIAMGVTRTRQRDPSQAP